MYTMRHSLKSERCIQRAILRTSSLVQGYDRFPYKIIITADFFSFSRQGIVSFNKALLWSIYGDRFTRNGPRIFYIFMAYSYSYKKISVFISYIVELFGRTETLK